MDVLGHVFVRIEGVKRACQQQYASEMTGQCGRNRDAPPKAKQKRSRRNCLSHVHIRIASNTLVPFRWAPSCLNHKELSKDFTCQPAAGRPLYWSEESTRVGEHVCGLLSSTSGNFPMLAEHREHIRSPQFHHRSCKKPRIALGIEERALCALLRCAIALCSFRFRKVPLCIIRASFGGFWQIRPWLTSAKTTLNTKHQMKSVMMVTPVISCESKQ